MANEEQLAILKQGAEVWNKWRSENSNVKPDLSGADLIGTSLRGADLIGTNLNEANLSWADLTGAFLGGSDLRSAGLRGATLWGANLGKSDLTGANLSRTNLTRASLREANLRGADLREADLSKANLRGAQLNSAILITAHLSRADLSGANLREADLSEANLSGAVLVGADLSEAELSKADLTLATFVHTIIDRATISGSLVFAINVWDLRGEFAEQKDLVITPEGAPIITVDNIKVAQFIYLILNNEEIRDVINTLTSKSVLILGRFAVPERKAILDALRNKLREFDLLPIVFDFDRPTDKDFTETIKTLAGLSYFVIADVTNPKSSPLELQATVPDYQIPFVPIIQEGEQPFAMMVDLHKKYNWVLEPRSYDSIDTLMKALKPGIIDPAIKLHYELRLIKAKEQVIHPLRDFIDG
jgi:uncharacterized protein YjbI with pentapeptide repeats